MKRIWWLCCLFVIAVAPQTWAQPAPSVHLGNVQPHTSNESFTIENMSDRFADIGNWRIEAGRQYPLGQRFVFPERCIVPVGGVVYVHAGPAQENQTNTPCGQREIHLIWHTRHVLADDMGFVEVYNPQGVLQASAQYPKPYTESNIRFRNGEVVLSGTLTVPHTPGPHPAAVLISGSGEQDRDQTLNGFRTFEVIADHLARQGIAVLRYDDRGMGGSSGSELNATLSDRAGDVAAAVSLLARHAEIDPQQIGLIGHSEGGMVAPMVAADNPDLAFVVMLAGLGVKGDELLLAQTERSLRVQGASQNTINIQLNVLRLVFSAIRSDTSSVWQAVVSSLRDLGTSPNAIQQQLDVVRSPWYGSMIAYDPATYLFRLQAPTLAVFGALDVQVPYDVNLKGMQRLVSQANHQQFQFHVFEHANHLFQHAITGHTDEYDHLPKRYVAGFLGFLGDWISRVVN